MPRQDLIAIRRGTAAQWTSANPTLSSGEQGFETDTNKLKIGDGSTAWNSLDYLISDTSNEIEVNQTAHGFSVGEGIKHNGTIYVKAIADSVANADVTWIVSEVADADNVKLKPSGLLAGSYTSGASYYLSPTTAGLIVTPAPTLTAGQVLQFVGTGTPDGLLINIDVGIEIVEEAPEPITLGFALSDELSDLTITVGALTFRMPCAMTLTEVRASCNTAPTGAKITVDIKENGTSILSTKLTIDATQTTSTTASVPVVISDSNLTDDSIITANIDGVGSTVAGTGLKLWLIGTKA